MEGSTRDTALESLPSRERELKLSPGHLALGGEESLPSRERELKLHEVEFTPREGDVAPFTGA